jgi:erythronate-4-phosphate dehydrogenase
LTLTLLADENIPALEHYLDGGIQVRRTEGRRIRPELLSDVDILLVRSVTRVDEALLAGSSLRFVGTATSGVDHIDRDYLEQRGIAFAHAAGANANSVVEYVLCAIAAVGDRLERLLDGGEVGIVGCGCVGRSLAGRLGALGIGRRVYDPWLAQETVPAADSLESVLECEVVSLHPELTRLAPWPSYHLIGAGALSRMRPDALLINTSRGQVLDSAALFARLERDDGLQAVLDVWEPEPAINPTLLERLALGTPHIAGYSRDGKLRATRMLAQAVAEHFQLSMPAGACPENGTPAIRVSGPASPAGLMRSLLASRYDIREDDRQLRRVARAGATDIGAGFDRLRRTYRERRELAGSRVSGGDGTGAHRALVEALGCVLEASGP